MKKYFPILLALFISIIPVQLRAEKNETNSLPYNLRLDLAATAISAAGWLTMEASENYISPSSCRWCGVNSFDNWGHNNLKWSNIKTANTISAVSAYGVAPIITLGLDALAAYKSDVIQNFWIDTLVIAEATALSGLFSQIIKISVGRQRPDVHYGEVGLGNSTNTSFYSGHVDLAFALAVSSGTVATMRKYELAPWIWGSGLTVAATTGYLRIAADKHYITDVIGGAVIGSAFGFGIPYLFHRPEKPILSGVMISPTPLNGGMALNVSGVL